MEVLHETAGSLTAGDVAATVVDASASDAGSEKRRECISVVARVRPCENPCANIALRQQSIEVAIPRTGGDATNPRVDEYRFQFANVYGPESTQSDVFNGTARDMVLGALDGVNCTIFAYGQTGSGKTHTICGGKGSYNDRGIIPRALGCIFDAISSRQDSVKYIVKVAFIEVYKEVGYNLLAKDFGKSANWPVVSVSIIDDQPVLNNASPVIVGSEDEGLHQYFTGDTHRTVAETPHNLNSSRSHCLFTIFIEAVDAVAQTVRTSKVQIVDLAGSERLKPYEVGSQNDKVLMGQAVSINLSLHWLEAVINALNSRARGSVPYRNSFLTKVLKDALGGNARAVMVATINPSDVALPESLSTCRFSQRVANVQTNARVNEELDPKLLIAALKQEKAELRAALSAAEGGEPAEELSADDLRQKIRLFLEDDTGGGGGAHLSVGCLRDAFAAFRIFREFFWELLRTRAAQVPPSNSEEPPALNANQVAAGSGSLPSSSRDPAAVKVVNDNFQESASSGDITDSQDSTQVIEALKFELKERDGELKMLRASLAAQPARPVARPSRPAPPLRSIRIAVGTQTEGVRTPKQRAKPRRPSSADARPNRPAASFSMDDVVERSFSRDASSSFLPKLTDPRVPDFRSRRRESESDVCTAPTGIHAEEARAQTGIDLLRSGETSQPPRSRNNWTFPANAAELVKNTTSAAPQMLVASAESHVASVQAPAPKPAVPTGASAAWLSATTGLTKGELALMGDAEKAKEIFLQHDPRAGDIWPMDMKKLRSERLERMEEARKLGEDIERIKEAKAKVQTALEALKVKFQEAEAQAAIDPGGQAQKTAATLRDLLNAEEPKLVQLLNEKQQRYELDYGRLAELKRELAHLKHGEDKLSNAIQAEFTHWHQAVEERYPGSTKPGCRSSPSGTPPPLPRPQAAAAPAGSSTTSDALAGGPPGRSPSLSSLPAGASASSSGLDPCRGAAAIATARASTAVAPEPSNALDKAEAALQSLRERLQEARQSGDSNRQQMLEQLLSVEEPRIARLRSEGIQ